MFSIGFKSALHDGQFETLPDCAAETSRLFSIFYEWERCHAEKSSYHVLAERETGANNLPA